MIEIYAKTITYLVENGYTEINKLPGAFVHKIDDQWTIAINAHHQPIYTEPEGCMGGDLLPFHLYVWYNGWIAGIVNPDGGEFAAGSDANEDSYLAALAGAPYTPKADDPPFVSLEDAEIEDEL